MPFLELGGGTTINYMIDDFTDPWRSAEEIETVVLVHGMAESSRAWFSWVPALARSYRVVRIDMPGLGLSTIDLNTYEWSLTSVARDLNLTLDLLNIQSAHFVGAKVGGSVVLEYAARYPERVTSAVSIGGPLWPQGGISNSQIPSISPTVREKGVTRWARESMPARLGSGASQAQLRWWTNFMSSSNNAVVIEATRAAASIDLRPLLPLIEAPALLITSSTSRLSQDSGAELWAAVRHGRSIIIESDGYHLAATNPEECLDEVTKFLSEHGAATK